MTVTAPPALVAHDILSRHVVDRGDGGQLKFNNDDSDYDLFYHTS